MNARITSAAVLALLLAACTTMPTGPRAMALPGTGKGFEQFRADDSSCRRYASDQIGGRDAERAANESFVNSAALGTVVGAAAGAAIGGRNGAGVGAGTGLLFGTAAGSGAAQSSGYEMQRRYDQSYLQCMYGLGHRIPVNGRLTSQEASPARSPAAPPPPPPRNVPPPPPGSPPPPPPGVPPPPPPGA